MNVDRNARAHWTQTMLMALAATGWGSLAYIWWGGVVRNWPEVLWRNATLCPLGKSLCVRFPFEEHLIEGPLFNLFAALFIYLAVRSSIKLWKSRAPVV